MHVHTCRYVPSAANNTAMRHSFISIFAHSQPTTSIFFFLIVASYSAQLSTSPNTYFSFLFFFFLFFVAFRRYCKCTTIYNFFNSIAIQYYSVFRIYIPYVFGENVCAPTIGTERCLSQCRSNNNQIKSKPWFLAIRFHPISTDSTEQQKMI